jgi:hypothetical protein
MATHEQRIAELERQLAQLRRDFTAASGALEAAFAAGRASLTAPLPRPADRAPRESHLRLVGGCAR